MVDFFTLLLLSYKGFESSEDILFSSKTLADSPCVGDDGGVGEGELKTVISISVSSDVMVLVVMSWIMEETDIGLGRCTTNGGGEVEGGEAGGLVLRGSADAGLRDISIQMESGGLPKSLSNRLELDLDL